jgi:hypothetical protein
MIGEPWLAEKCEEFTGDGSILILRDIKQPPSPGRWTD